MAESYHDTRGDIGFLVPGHYKLYLITIHINIIHPVSVHLVSATGIIHWAVWSDPTSSVIAAIAKLNLTCRLETTCQS